MADKTKPSKAEVKRTLDQQAGDEVAPTPANDGGIKTTRDGDIFDPTMPIIAKLPKDASVRALGTYINKLYFLDAHDQLRELGAKDVNRSMILHLFGDHTKEIYDLWPTMKRQGERYVVTGWDGTKAQESLMRACARKGIWRPQDHVQGRGAWEDDQGRLVIHSGHRLYLSDGTEMEPGLIDRTVYPAGVHALAPAGKDTTEDPTAAAAELLELFETWNWQRDFDPRLLLGWVAASMLSGALKVRPLVWVTGEKGTGKSSLVGEGGIIHQVFGSGILMTANTTAAGLYQKIEYDALPVAIDEIEAKRGNQKTESVIELARQAYSGGMVLRGGADHEGKEFRARSSVLFGSILIPPLMPQDLSRLALLNLKPFDKDAKEPEIDPARLAKIGELMLRRLLDRWPEWKDRLSTWHGYLRGMGHSGRASDQFGTLLAAADIVLQDKAPDEEWMRVVAGSMTPINLKETEEESTNAARCISYAMSRPIQSMRGHETMSVSELVACAVRRYSGEMENPIEPMNAIRNLERSGVSVLCVKSDGGELSYRKPNRTSKGDLDWLLDKPAHPMGVFVCFAPDGDGILELFKGSDWEGQAGALNPYKQALERVQGAHKCPKPIRLGVQSVRPIMIPIENCVDLPTRAELQALESENL